MSKVQDLFKKPDGSKLLDVKLLMKIVDIPTTSVDIKTDKGTFVTLFQCKMEHQGQMYDWDLSPAQLSRIFTKTARTGAVVWNARNGDLCNVMLSTPKGAGKFPYYDAEAVAGTAPDGEMTPVQPSVDLADAADDVFGDPMDSAEKVEVYQEGVKVAVAPVAPKPGFVKTNRFSKPDAPQWDGTPRQSGMRMAVAGLRQALYSNPNINPKSEEDVNWVRTFVSAEVLNVREVANELEASLKD